MIEKINDTRVPTEDVMRQVAHKLFLKDTALEIQSGTWIYQPVVYHGRAVVKFSLGQGAETLFSRVHVHAFYDSANSCKLHVRGSINGLPYTAREFYVVEECITGEEAARMGRNRESVVDLK